MNNIQNTYIRPVPHGWRERMMNRFRMGMYGQLRGREYTLPSQLVSLTLATFIIAFAACTFTFGYAMPTSYAIYSIASVIIFLYGVKGMASSWKNISDRQFAKNLFIWALVIRLIWIIFHYFYYNENFYNQLDGFGDDNGWYMYFAQGIASWLKGDIKCSFPELMDRYNALPDDTGYPVWLGVLLVLTDSSSDVFVPLLFKVFFSAYSCICVYQIAKRHFGEGTARLAGLFMCLNPLVIFWCSCLLKETEMMFLCCLYLNESDKALSSKKVTFKGLLPGILAAIALLFFRTPLGIVAFLAMFIHIVLSSKRVMSYGKKVLVGIMVGVILLVGLGDRLRTQSKMLVEEVKSGRQQENMEWRSERQGGNLFAKYAGAAVFAPLIFTLPFPTFNEANETQIFQMEMSGACFIKNIFSYFVIIALFLLLISGEWRSHVFILSYTVGYHIVLVMSQFAQSGRFHMPVYPMFLILAAYGIQISKNNPRIKKGFSIVMIVEVIACLAWNWFKLKGRGMV